MYGVESQRDVRALQFYLYGGMSPEEFEREGGHPSYQSRPRNETGVVTGYAVYNLKTREITCVSVPRGRTSRKPSGLEK